jgi:cytochrome c peroxidase
VVLRRGWSIGAFLTQVALVCLLPTRAGQAADEPKMLNPFAGDPEAVKQGRKLYQSNGCSGCHGLGGGGGMGKPILDDLWIYGSDDETLFRLIKGQVPGQSMPRSFVGLPAEQVWRLLAYVRSLYKGDPTLINWPLTPPEGSAAMIAEFAKPKAYTPPKGLHDQEVPTPSDNPITPNKVKLGEQLFFDKRLSKGKTMSCESCHIPEKGWTDGLEFSKKFDGTLNTRHTQTLFGAGFLPELYWDGRAQGLEALIPDVVKTQMGGDLEEVAKELGTVPAYKVAFDAEMGGPPTPDRIAKALATFVRTIHAGDTPYDNLPEGSEDEIAQGFKVFSEVTHCTLCHLPPLFSDTLFHNMGVGSDRENPDPGRYKVVEDAAKAARARITFEMEAMTGAFKTPSLRGLLLRAPYFHDGRAKTYDEAAGIMMKGGIPNPHLDEKLKEYPVTPEQRTQLLAFLRSLTPENKPYPRPEVP